MSDPFEKYDPFEMYDPLTKEGKSLYSFKEFFNYHFYGGLNDKSSTKEQRQTLVRNFVERLMSLDEDEQYFFLHDFCDFTRWMKPELFRSRDHERISKELEAQKKETSNAYRLMFFIFVLGCILGEIRGRFF